jgi:YgiT-type zinc finger domain-containing protein
MNNNQDTMVTCDKCGKEGAKIRRVSKSYGEGEALLVIENVPVISCPTCRETHLTADTVQGINRIKSNRDSHTVARPVSVAIFA